MYEPQNVIKHRRTTVLIPPDDNVHEPVALDSECQKHVCIHFCGTLIFVLRLIIVTSSLQTERDGSLDLVFILLVAARLVGALLRRRLRVTFSLPRHVDVFSSRHGHG